MNTSTESRNQKAALTRKEPTDTELSNIFAYIEAYPELFRWMVIECSEDIEYREGRRLRIKNSEYRIATLNEDGDCENVSEPFPSYGEAQAEADRRNGGSVAEHLSRLSQTKVGTGNA